MSVFLVIGIAMLGSGVAIAAASNSRPDKVRELRTAGGMMSIAGAIFVIAGAISVIAK